MFFEKLNLIFWYSKMAGEISELNGWDKFEEDFPDVIVKKHVIEQGPIEYKFKLNGVDIKIMKNSGSPDAMEIDIGPHNSKGVSICMISYICDGHIKIQYIVREYLIISNAWNGHIKITITSDELYENFVHCLAWITEPG